MEDYWKRHNEEVAALTEKYIGQETVKQLETLDLWFKKRWYIAQIKRLMHSAGRISMKMKRCKRTDSKVYIKYQETETELSLLVDNLALDLIDLK